MGKEVKIGLAVIGVLLCVFGGVLAMRLKREQPPNALEKVAAAEKEGKIGRKKKPLKTGKSGNAESGEQGTSVSLSSLEQPASSRSRRNKSVEDSKTDRYGRPLENDWASPAEGELQDEVPPDQTAPLTLRSPDEADLQVNDRYARRGQRDPLQDQPADGGEMPVEEPVQQDASPSIDRFAQMPGGLSFSDDEPAQETNELTDDASADDPQANATRLTAAPASAAFDFNNPTLEPSDEAAADNQDADLADAGSGRIGMSDEEPNEVPAAADRFGDRFRERRDEPAMTAHEEPLDNAQPAEEPPVAEAPQRWQDAASGSYTVEANDNFWRISQKVYGTGAYFKALEEHNRQQLGNRAVLNVGDVISTPPIAELQRDHPGLSPKPRDLPGGRRSTALAGSSSRGGRTYTVLEGDTLFDIARAELGKASRWAEIFDLNRDQLGEDFNYLAPGMRLALPPGGNRNDPIATRPARDGYRR